MQLSLNLTEQEYQTMKHFV